MRQRQRYRREEGAGADVDAHGVEGRASEWQTGTRLRGHQLWDRLGWEQVWLARRLMMGSKGTGLPAGGQPALELLQPDCDGICGLLRLVSTYGQRFRGPKDAGKRGGTGSLAC